MTKQLLNVFKPWCECGIKLRKEAWAVEAQGNCGVE